VKNTIFVLLQFCDKSFENKVDLMNHKKEIHRENVESDWHYSAGFCPYGDRKCWFNHNKENSVEYNCNFCEQICRSQSDLRQHKKKKHKKRIPSCKNEECLYGRENCWFIHTTEESFNENEHENENLIERIINMLEKVSERIVKMELNNHTNHDERKATDQN
jgi:hypothetical protein